MHAVLLSVLLTLTLGVFSTPASGAQDDWMELSIAQLHAAMSEGRLSSEQLTAWYLERIDRLDQRTGINAIVTLNPSALDDARALDARFARDGMQGLLHGIPMLIKDNIDVAGLPTTAGSLALKGNIAAQDAHLVQRLRAEGAIILGKTNMAEWAFSPNITVSSRGGLTRNPYNLLHTTAGSSGGTAAAVAANFAVAGIGTDTGNSIRGPSSHQALVGIRSTMGLTSRHGVVPLYLRNDIAGPMARSVEDAARILQSIAGTDERDPVTARAPDAGQRQYVAALRDDALQGVRIGVMRYYTALPDSNAEINALFEQALRDLEQQGAVLVQDFAITGFESLIQNNWCNTFPEDVNAYLAQQTQPLAAKTLDEVIASGLYLPSIAGNLQQMPTSGRSNAECLDLYSNPRNVAFRDAVLAAMYDHQVSALVYPTWSNPPRRIDDTTSPTGDNSQHIAPHTGLPAITLPMGFTAAGLPAGVSMVGALFAEATLLGYAYDYEQATLHRRAPPLTNQ
jgi:amidase